MTSHDPVVDHRTLMERAQHEASERRLQALMDQRSPANPPADRVRTWERLHQVRLPKDPQHNILAVVAEQTGLTLSEVRDVQSQRAQPISG